MAALPALGVTLPQFTADPGPALDACRDARRLGFPSSLAGYVVGLSLAP